MRDIKFRAWDKEQNKMLLPDKDDWYFCNEYGVLSFPVMIARGYVMGYQTKKELVLMQYTGLKDKNGVEIYEGDILALESHWGIRVEYEKGTMWVRDKDEIRYTNRILDVPISSITINMWEVAGNVFENPQLLEEV